MTDSVIALDTYFGIKSGMTRVFDEQGNHVPVTVIKLIPNLITQVKTQEKEGYTAYQVGYAEKRESLLTKPVKGHLVKASVSQNLTQFSEVKVENADAAYLGKALSLDSFAPGTYIDVTGISKGKGFAGVQKRYNFRGGPASHGSHFHRRVGSIGNRATPGRVFKNKKMPGHMGVDTKTIQNLTVFEVNKEKGYLLIRGSVPGGKNGFIRIVKALKKQ
jgi:large subunit ribosomal protein L3